LAEAKPQTETVTITVDGKELVVPAGELVIEAAEDNGNYIPRFCWHPRMEPVGMCRMCLVEIEGPRGTLLTTSCTARVADGMVVNTQSDTVKKAQEGVLEFLLINHPLDCPVCDRGGECPLQDQTMSYGPGESRFVEEKRHFEKPIVISDLVMLDRERCILCARCTRFCEEISGDPLIEFKDRGNYTQVLTFPDEPFASYFSGNTVQICPVGALTARPYRFRARPWDLEAVESSCTHCSVGCRISAQASQNEILRFNGVDNDPTNQGWLCDKGRFGFEFINSGERLSVPLVKGAGGAFVETTWGEALDLVADRLGSVRGDEVAGLGGARGTNEEAFAFGKFLRTIVVTPHLDAQLDDGLDPAFLVGVTPRAVIPDLETARTILVWGPDLKEELPVLYLRVRRAAQELGATLVVVHPRRTGLDDVADHVVRYQPGKGPDVLRRLAAGEGDLAAVREALGTGPVVALVGRPGLAEDPRLAEAVAAFARDLPGAGIMALARRSNVYGALDMGLAPTLLPGRVSATSESGRAALEAAWGPLPIGTGRDAAGILRGLAAGDLKALVLLGADPIRDFPDPAVARAGLEAAEFVVALDLFHNDSNAHADVILPVEGFTESEGTVTNLEGRVQKVNRLVPGPGQARASWSVLDDVARRMGGELAAPSAAALAEEIAAVAPAYAGIEWDLLDWGEGRRGVVVPSAGASQDVQYLPVDPGLKPVNARLTLHLARRLYDDGVLSRYGPSLAGLMPEAMVHLHPRDAAARGIAEGETVVISGEQGSLELPAAFDGSLAPGTAFVQYNLPQTAGLGAAVAVEVEVASGGGG
jgi:NADH-quinone oxidoreductase subunit G